MKKGKQEERLPQIKQDRRLLANVPDPMNRRQQIGRRGIRQLKENQYEYTLEFGTRYEVDVEVTLKLEGKDGEVRLKGRTVDLSDTGLLVELSIADNVLTLDQLIKVNFTIPGGVMKEGYDHKVKLKAKVVRFVSGDQEGKSIKVGLEFERPLHQYFYKRYWLSELSLSSLFLALIVFSIAFLRYDSVLYFKFEPLLYSYSLLTATYLLSRYLFGGLYRPVPVKPSYTPGVSVIIPCFNEEQWIQKTIISCLNQDYPVDQLEVIVVDDCSNDASVEKIEEIIAKLKSQCETYGIEHRLKFVPLQQNSGKRQALVAGVAVASHELVTFVDSDSFLQPVAIRHLVQPFQDPQVGGVTGRTDVENTHTNYITKMQAVRYYVAFRIIKAAESIFDAVTCLSGPISCYRKELILKYQDDWLNQTFLGQPATFGDDRSMTNFILKNYRTVYQDTAVCTTIVPSKFKVFLKQQMRWKRSWLRESLRAGGFMWKKEPFQAISFYAGFIVPIAAPIVVLYNLVYVPLVYQTFPLVFIMGILLMSLLMSFMYLWFRKSKIWIYGLWFCLFYEFILLWQMPIACVTFWKSTWGTRNTQEDIEEQRRKEEKKNRKALKSKLKQSA